MLEDCAFPAPQRESELTSAFAVQQAVFVALLAVQAKDRARFAGL